ncbi:MAG: transcription termination/antitermination protein NusG [Anaerolineales bacterium]|jgi:transcriptional antiterminator NusG
MDIQENEEQLEESAHVESEDALQDPEVQESDPQVELEEASAAEDEVEAAAEESEAVDPVVDEEELAVEEELEDAPEAELEAPEAEVEVEEEEEEEEEDEEEDDLEDDRYLTSTTALRAASEPVKDDGRAWYVIHCYSGNEDKVRHNIMQRIESMSMDNLIFDVVVPTEDEVNIKNGERQTVEKKVFPGYILVNMILTEESWYMVRNTPGVTGFVGMGNDPTPLQPEEVARILKRMESESPRINVTFRPGERVRIVDGPFEDFYGKVSEIDMERATVRVMVNFFGRETPVELDFLQVEEA